eukprot:357499-Chlamydomonas_euryale.AAC.7
MSAHQLLIQNNRVSGRDMYSNVQQVARYVCTCTRRTYCTYVCWGGKVRVPSTLSAFEPSSDASYNRHNSIHTAWISVFELES